MIEVSGNREVALIRTTKAPGTEEEVVRCMKAGLAGNMEAAVVRMVEGSGNKKAVVVHMMGVRYMKTGMAGKEGVAVIRTGSRAKVPGTEEIEEIGRASCRERVF